MTGVNKATPTRRRNRCGHIKEAKRQDADSTTALDAILRGRSEILQTRLAVAAVQIVERLRIRADNLDRLMEEDLDTGNRLNRLRERRGPDRSEFMGLETLLTSKTFDIESERRRQDVECWRDLVQVMRDFMDAWEGLSRVRAKERFLQGVGAPGADPSNYGIPAPDHYEHQDPTDRYH